MRKINLKIVLVLVFILTFSSASIFAEDSLRNIKLTHARRIVTMLDDMYKSFIVLVTEEYVKDPSMLSAATLSKRIFKLMKKHGWHEVRLLDATGSPFNPDNTPKGKFERDAISALMSGSPYYEKIEMVEGKEYLRAATVVSAVVEGCMYCHPVKKVGDIVGALSYKIPLE